MRRRSHQVYKTHFILAGFLCLLITFLSTTAWAGWYDANWSYRKQITIDQSMAPSDQPWFPVLIYEASDAQLAASACSNGEDILFTKSDGTSKVHHEIEDFNNGSGKLTAWVEIENLSSSSNTIIYMYYGNGACVNQENVSGTWDEGGSNNYHAVYHLNEDPSISTDGDCSGIGKEACDSTSKSNDLDAVGSMQSSDLVPGKIGGAVDFDDVDTMDYLMLSDANLSAGFPGKSIGGYSGPFTLSAWVNVHSLPTSNLREYELINKYGTTSGQRSFRLSLEGSSGQPLEVDRPFFGPSATGGLGTYSHSTTKVTVSSWYYVVGVYDGVDLRMYFNANMEANAKNPRIYSSGINLGTDDFVIGARTNAPARWADAIIDEARVASTNRSANWIQTEFNNQNNPSAYLTFDPQEKVISGTAFNDEGSTLIGDGAVIRLLRNGSSVGTYTTTGGTGTYSIPVATLNANDDLLVYIDGHATDGTTVTVSDGDSLSGLDIYGGHLITRHDNAGSLTNAMMKNAKEPYVDTEILYSVDGSNNLTVEGTGTELYVWSGDTFTPGANVDTTHVKIEGTWTSTGSESYTVSGSWENNGTFDDATSTVTFDATTTGQTITSSGSDFYNVVFNGSGGEWTLQDNFRQNSSGTTAFTNGELIFNGFDYQAIRGQTVNLGNGFTLTIGTGRLINNGNMHITVNTGSTVTISTGYMGVNNLTVSGSGIFTCTGNSQINVAGNINITSANWTPGTSTINHIYLTKTLNTTQPLYNYIVGHSGLSYNVDITLQNNITIQNNFTIEAGTGGTKSFDTAGYNMNVGGNWDSSGGTFTHGNNTVVFDAGTTGKTITAGGESFYNVIFNNASGDWTFQDTFSAANDFAVTDTGTTGNGVDTNNQTVNVTRDLTITAGNFTTGTSTITVGRNWDSSGMENMYGLWGSTVVLTGTGNVRQRTAGGGWNYLFDKISLAAAGQTTTLTSSNLWTANQMTVGSGTFTDGAGSYTVYLQGTGDVLVDGGATITVQNLYYRANSGGLNVAGLDYTGINTLGFYGVGQASGSLDHNMQGNIIANNIRIWPNNSGGHTSNSVLTTNNYSLTATSLSIGRNTDTNDYALLNAGSSTIDINGNVIIYPSDANGTNEINAGSSTWTVSGNWTNNDTFTAGTSTIEFDGTLSRTLDSGGSAFNNLEINKTSGTDANDNITVQTNDLTVNGTLSITDGELVQQRSITSGAVSLSDPSSKWTNTTDNADVTLSSTVSNAGTITFDAPTGDLIQIRSSVGGTQRNWQGPGTFSMTDVDVQDQTCLGGTPADITVTSGTDTGNNINWIFGSSIIGGTVYTDDDEATTLNNKAMTVVVYNGSTQASYTTTTDGSGLYSITNGTLAAEDIIAVYLNDEAEEGTTVFKSDGNNVADLNVYQNHVSIRSDSGAISNAEIANVDDGDDDMKYNVSGNDITLDSGYELFVFSGSTYTPGGNVTTQGAGGHVDLNGTLTAGSNTITVSADWDSTGGTFNYDTSTVIIGTNGQSNTITTDPNATWTGAIFYNLSISNGADIDINSGTGLDRIKIYGLLTVTGTLTVPAGLTISMVYPSNNVTIDPTGEIAGAGTFERAVDDTPTHIVNNGTISVNTFLYSIRTWSIARPVTATTYGGNVIIKNWGSEDWPAYLGCTAEPVCPDFVVGGTLKIYHDRDGKVLSLDNSVYNIPITASEMIVGDPSEIGCAYLTAGSPAITINGDVTINQEDTSPPTHAACDNTIDADTSTINVSGNWTNNDTFTAGSSTVVLTGGNQTLSGSTTFNNLTKTESNDNATDVTLTFDNNATQTINGTLTVDGLDDDDRINLVSDSPGNYWEIVLGAAAVKVIDYVDVQDSDASGSDAAKKPVDPADSLNSGNNVDWFYVLTIVKQVWEEGGNAPLGNPTAPVGATLVFLIYVKNTNASAVTDLRINDDLDEAGFEYVAGSMVRTDAGTPPTDNATDKQIFDATASGTGTDILDPVDADVASAQDTGDPGIDIDKITIGAVVGQANASLDMGAHETFALRFKVKVK